jgi:hypothetical protein
MHLQEQNWSYLYDDITTEEIAWHGIWTVYSPAKEFVNSYQGVRRFRANEDKTVIYQSNTYTYPNGRVQEQSWQIDKQSCNQPDGVTHPHILTARALSFGAGVNAWISQKVDLGKYFNVELFFRYQDWRTSVAIIYYEEDCHLEKIYHIREYRGSFPQEPAGLELENISGNWKGKKESKTPDLQVSASEIPELVLAPIGGKNETFFLPDGIVVNIPKSLKVNEAFEIVAGKLVAENQFNRLTVQYDDSGAFTRLISEVFGKVE